MKKERMPGLIGIGVMLLLFGLLAACKQAPELPAPENVAIAMENGVPRVVWDAVPGADCYYVYRIKEGDESFGYWGITKETQLSDPTVQDSAVYAYKIFGAKTDGKKYLRSNAGTVTPYFNFLQAPRISSVVVSASGCTVTWEPVNTATEYEVLRAESETGHYTALTRTDKTTYVDAGASAEKSYYYQVRACGQAGGKRTESPAGKAPASLVAPTSIHVLRMGEQTATVYWDLTKQAVNYIVYRAENPAGPFVVAGQTDQRIFRDSAILEGTQDVYYMVQATLDSDGVTLRSIPSATYIAEKPKSVTNVFVIMYHDFVTAKEIEGGMALDEYAIYIDEFEQDLQLLRSGGYHVIGLKDLVAYLDEGTPLPDRAIILTIDDGSLGVYQYAYPLLQKYGMHATLNVIGANIDAAGTREDRMVEGKAYCTWEEIGEMGRSGTLEILPHGYYLHTYASDSKAGFARRANETMEAYTKRLSDDLLPLNAKIEQYTGQKPLGVAYPYSVWSDDGNVALTSIGYRFMLSGESARTLRMNHFVDGLDPSLQDPMLTRITRLTGIPLRRYLRRAMAADPW